MKTFLKCISIILSISVASHISASLSSSDSKKIESIRVALDKLGSDKNTADINRTNLSCNLTPPFDPKPTGVCKDVCDFGKKWEDKDVPIAIAKKAAEKCACSCARMPNNYTWEALMKRIGQDKYNPYFAAGIDPREIESFPSASSLDKDVEGTSPNKDAALLIRGGKCQTLNDLTDSKTKSTCENVCRLGRGWNLMPKKEALAAALKCACYCEYNKHPKAAETLKNIVKAQYGNLTSKESLALSKYK